jgi:hypothetical protein
MGLLKRLLQEQKDGSLLRRAVTMRNYEFYSAADTEGKKKDLKPSNPKPSQILKKV